jgi:hypothetical protein
MKYRNLIFILMVLASILPLACQNTYTVGPLSAGLSATATKTATSIFVGTSTPTPTITATNNFTSTATFTITSTATFTATNTVTSTPPASTVNYSCSSDTAAAVTVIRTINPSKSFVPLCNGIILYGDRENAQIVEYNVITNTTLQTFALTGTPGDLALDSTNGYLYCTLDGASKIERVNLTTGVVIGIPTTDIGDHLCTSGTGLVFVCQGVWASQTLTILNGNAGTVLNTVAISEVGFPVFEASTNTLYFGEEGVSPSYLHSYAYNPGSYTITQNAVNMSAGSNGEDIALSPDDTHLAFPVGSGNTTPPYTIVDYPPTNVNGSNGSWNTGDYPSSAGFSPDSQHIVSTNGPSVFVFSTSNYTTSKTWATVGNYGISILRTRFSQGGDFVFMLMGDKTSTTAPASIFCSNYP